MDLVRYTKSAQRNEQTRVGPKYTERWNYSGPQNKHDNVGYGDPSKYTARLNYSKEEWPQNTQQD